LIANSRIRIESGFSDRVSKGESRVLDYYLKTVQIIVTFTEEANIKIPRRIAKIADKM